MSPMMVRFLKSYRSWAIAKENDDGDALANLPDFSPCVGLCANTIDFVRWDGGTDYAENMLPDWHNPDDITEEDVADALRNELADLFYEDGLDDQYPFGLRAYDYGASHDKQHMDVNRRAWLDEKVGQNV